MYRLFQRDATVNGNVTRTSGTPTLTPIAPVSALATMSSEAVRAARVESAHMRRRSFWWEVWREIYLAGESILPRQCLANLFIVCPLWTCTAAGTAAHSWLALATSSSITSRSARVYQRPRTITASIPPGIGDAPRAGAVRRGENVYPVSVDGISRRRVFMPNNPRSTPNCTRRWSAPAAAPCPLPTWAAMTGT